MEIAHLYAHYLSAEGVSTDTRSLKAGELFFALKGPNFDGNTHAAEALEKGALAVVVDDPKLPALGNDARYLWVEDVLSSLQALARHHREQLQIPVLALTGSNGKTTTKELLHAALARKFRVGATYGNLNNHIGVPLTLLRLPKDTELAIIEMGANKQGDIQELCAIALPTHGLITNIGKAHLEGMGGAEGVLKTKTELFQHLRSTGGMVFLNTLDPKLVHMEKRFQRVFTYPLPGNHFSVQLVDAAPFVRFTVEGSETIHPSRLLGAYNFGNIAAALAVAAFFEVPEQEAIAAIAAYTPENMRSQVLEKRTNTILLDAYNANPSSMEAAILAFGQMESPKKKMLILGDMYELGEETEEEHARLGELVSRFPFEVICFTGRHVQAALSRAPMRALYFPDPFSFRNWLADSALEEHLILIKGSRGMKLEGLVDFI